MSIKPEKSSTEDKNARSHLKNEAYPRAGSDRAHSLVQGLGTP